MKYSTIPRSPFLRVWPFFAALLLLLDPSDHPDWWIVVTDNFSSGTPVSDSLPALHTALAVGTQTTVVSFNSLWCLSHLSTTLYIVLISSLTLYLLPNISTTLNSAEGSRHGSYLHISAQSVSKLLHVTLFLIFVINLTWSGPSVAAWYNHFIFSELQHRISYFVLLVFVLVLQIHLTSFVFNNKYVYDYLIVIVNSLVWVTYIFYSNNLFTTVFLVEMLSLLTLLNFVTSSLHVTHFYAPTSLENSKYFAKSTPQPFLTSLLFLFWTTLVASLLLFLATILFYTHLLTFDFLHLESALLYTLSTASLYEILTVMTLSSVLFLALFLKCGVAPLFFWKPTFFKGSSLSFISFYTTFVYFFFLLYLTYLLVVLLNDFVYLNRMFLTLFILVGTSTLISTLLESQYVKAFVAMSSILNTLMLILGLTMSSSLDLTIL